MEQIQEAAQVLAHRLEQLRPLQFGGHDQQRAIGDDVVGEGAALGELAVAIDVDPFGEPLVDPPHVAAVGKELVDLCERRAQYPAVVGGVNAAFGHPGPGAYEKRPEDAGDLLCAVEPANRRRCRDVVDHEAGVGRRIEVRGEQVDVALGTLGTLQKACSDANAFEEHGRSVKRRPGVN